jgi:hypothetical protein
MYSLRSTARTRRTVRDRRDDRGVIAKEISKHDRTNGFHGFSRNT